MLKKKSELKMIFFVIFLTTNVHICLNSLPSENEDCVDKKDEYFLNRLDPYLNKNVTFSCFQNFNAFKDVLMSCGQRYNTTSTVQFRPNRKILVDKNFTFANLIYSSSLLILETLVFYNIKGVDLNSRIVKRNMLHLSFVFSEFNIYSNGTLLTECTPNKYESKYLNIISTFKTVYFRQVTYPKSIVL